MIEYVLGYLALGLCAALFIMWENCNHPHVRSVLEQSGLPRKWYPAIVTGAVIILTPVAPFLALKWVIRR